MSCRRKINQEHYDDVEGWKLQRKCDHPASTHNDKGCQVVLSTNEIEDDDGRWVTFTNQCSCLGFVGFAIKEKE